MLEVVRTANDTMIMVEGLKFDIINLKFLLTYFEAMSGLKINFNKKRGCGHGVPSQGAAMNNLKCKVCAFHMYYLGDAAL